MSMGEFYDKKSTDKKQGPSDLTIKRILAFSKALGASNKRAQSLANSEKNNN